MIKKVKSIPIEFINILQNIKEERYIEFKRTINWDKTEIKAKITKSVLGMSNIRDGGYIVIGVEENKKDDLFEPVGMNEEDFHSFKEDDVKAHISNYADPYCEFDMYKFEFEKKNFIIFKIKEFREDPIICKKSGIDNLRNGAIYTRTRRKNETADVPSHAELREIIEMAVDKKIAEFNRMKAIEIQNVTISNSVEDDSKLFDRQLGGI